MAELKNGQMQFTGTLDAVKKVDTEDGIKHIHKFLIPAINTLNYPTQLYVGSPRQICDLTKEATVTVSVYGWSRKFTTKNGERGSNQNHALDEVI